MEPGYWIVDDIDGKGEREVVLLDEDGSVWACGNDFPMEIRNWKFIRKIDLNSL